MYVRIQQRRGKRGARARIAQNRETCNETLGLCCCLYTGHQSSLVAVASCSLCAYTHTTKLCNSLALLCRVSLSLSLFLSLPLFPTSPFDLYQAAAHTHTHTHLLVRIHTNTDSKKSTVSRSCACNTLEVRVAFYIYPNV